MMKIVRVICLIPSITETLLECGVQVVGRTRYCIHPQQKVQGIPIVGGTKRVQAAELAALNPDLIVMDKEENTKEMAEALTAHNLNLHVMHVQSLQDLERELQRLEEVLQMQNRELGQLVQRLQRVLQKKKHVGDLRNLFLRKAAFDPAISSSEGFLENTKGLPRKLNYIIWKNPWMMIGPQTYIQDVLSFVGFELAYQGTEKYPQITEIPFDQPTLYSSEPYPFFREWKAISQDHRQSLLVDGERVSWFGVRSLVFLEELVGHLA